MYRRTYYYLTLWRKAIQCGTQSVKLYKKTRTTRF